MESKMPKGWWPWDFPIISTQIERKFSDEELFARLMGPHPILLPLTFPFTFTLIYIILSRVINEMSHKVSQV
jgi:hypothetical protein